VRVTAPPEGGKANDAVVKVLAKSLGLPKSAIEVTRGHSSRHKLLMFDMPEEHYGVWVRGVPYCGARDSQ